MDLMIAIMMEIAVFVCRLTLYGSEDGAVVNFY